MLKGGFPNLAVEGNTGLEQMNATGGVDPP